MKLTSIYIDNFGKLKDFHITFNQGLNVFLGENEEGKTTLMAFVYLMFYGPSTTAKSLDLNLRKKYMPWDGSPMGGAIEFFHNENNYRLERLFKKTSGTDIVKLFNRDTGEDISISDNGKIGNIFLGMGESTFLRTLYIGQGKSVPDAGLSGTGEMITRLQNLVSTGEERYSYTAVKKNLSNAYEKLYSKKGKVGLIDKMEKTFFDLEEERADALMDEELKKGFFLEEMSLNDSHTALNNELGKKKREMEYFRDILSDLNSLKILQLEEKEKNLRALYNEKSEKISADDFVIDSAYIERISSLINNLQIESSLLEKNKENQIKHKTTLSELYREKDTMPDEEEYSQGKDIINQINRVEAEIRGLKTEDLSSEMKSIEDEARSLEEEKAASFRKGKVKRNAFVLISVFIALASISIGLALNDFLWFSGVALSLLFLIPGLYGFSKIKRADKVYNNKLDNLDHVKRVKLNMIREQDVQSDLLNNNLEQLNSQISLLYDKYGFKDFAEMELSFSDSRVLRGKISQIETLLEQMQEENDDLSVRLQNIGRIFSEESKGLFVNINPDNYPERLEEIRKDYNDYLRIESEMKSLREEIESSLNGRSFDELRNSLKRLRWQKNVGSYGKYESIGLSGECGGVGLSCEHESTGGSSSTEYEYLNTNDEHEDIAALNNKHEGAGGLSSTEYEDLNTNNEHEGIGLGDENEIREKLNILKSETEDIESQILQIEKNKNTLMMNMKEAFYNKRELSQIDEDMEILSKKIMYWRERAKEIKYAEDVLDDSFQEMQKSFSPIVNKKTSDIFARITGNKYRNLFVDKNFNIDVREPERNITVDGEYLSGGTLDQLYFSLRMAIGEFFSEQSGGLPVFLDDPFIQYDDIRRDRATVFLSEYAKEQNRQIIFFTCHKTTAQGFSDYSGLTPA